MQLVVPRAVSTAVMTDAMICSVHFSVSLFVIIYLLSCRKCYTFLDDHHNQFPAWAAAFCWAIQSSRGVTRLPYTYGSDCVPVPLTTNFSSTP